MQLATELHVYDDAEPKPAALNMAVDEALLESVSVPSLRFYRWERPSLSFGYFGAFAEVANETRDLVRRWTGGGIVLHGTDLTYSLILPGGGSRGLPSSRIIYAEVHRAIQRALTPHLAVELAPRDAPKSSTACFANPVTADVLTDGRKIAGAAQRRTRRGLLHQGSIQLQAFPISFPDDFARELCPGFTRQEIRPAIFSRAGILAHEKYGTDAWLHRH